MPTVIVVRKSDCAANALEFDVIPGRYPPVHLKAGKRQSSKKLWKIPRRAAIGYRARLALIAVRTLDRASGMTSAICQRDMAGLTSELNGPGKNRRQYHRESASGRPTSSRKTCWSRRAEGDYEILEKAMKSIPDRRIQNQINNEVIYIKNSSANAARYR